MRRIELIVTRHPALIEYMIEEGLAGGDTEVVSHASPENVRGKNVAGVLPHSLSCLAESFTEIPLMIPAEKRGKELTLSDMREFAKPAATYVIRRQE